MFPIDEILKGLIRWQCMYDKGHISLPRLVVLCALLEPHMKKGMRKGD